MTLPRQTTWAPRWFVLLVAGLFSLSLSVILFSGGAAAAFPSNHDSAVSAYEGPSRLSPVARGELAAIVGADHSWRANRGAGPKASGSVAVSGFVVAAKTVPKAVNGETAATAYGRLMHQTYNYGPGFRREFPLNSGRRADAVNIRIREVIELKPNNPRQIRQGNQQLQSYIDELNDMYKTGPRWTGRVETYDRP